MKRKSRCLCLSHMLWLLLIALAPLRAGPETSAASLVPNTNLETDANGDNWPDNWPASSVGGTGSWLEEEGNHFIRLTATAPDQTIMLYREIFIPDGTQALEVSWRWRLIDVKPGKQPWFDARFLLEFTDAGRVKTGQNPAPSYGRGTTGGWVTRKINVLVPPGARYLKFMPSLFRAESGIMDIDDIVIRPCDPTIVLAAQKEAEEIAKARYVPPEEANKARWPAEIRVRGNRLVDASGREVWLQGVNAGGLETLHSDIQPIKSTLVAVSEWKANTIRLPIRDEFWQGLNPAQKDGGKRYRELVDQCVMIAANRGAYVIIDLHKLRAPRAEHVDFWKSVAAHYANHPAVLFDVFNEPFGITWDVWRDGGFVEEKPKQLRDESAFLSDEDKKKTHGFQSPGMQALVDAVRSTGAKNIVVAGGLFWCNDLTGIVNGYELKDRDGNGIMYAWHTYNWHPNWQRVLPVAAKHPVLVGEFGADTNKMNFIPHEAQEDPYTWMPDMMGFIQKHRLNWTAWCFHPKATPVLISDWKYTPTAFAGAFVKDALAGKRFEMKRMR